MKIAIIGTTAYRSRMEEYKSAMESEGHKVEIPAFDSHPEFDELGICAYNLSIIREADEVHIFWDARSTGTIFDLGMCFALGKTIRIKYMNPKTFPNLFLQYEEFCKFVDEENKKLAGTLDKGVSSTIEVVSR